MTHFITDNANPISHPIELSNDTIVEINWGTLVKFALAFEAAWYSIEGMQHAMRDGLAFAQSIIEEDYRYNGDYHVDLPDTIKEMDF